MSTNIVELKLKQGIKEALEKANFNLEIEEKDIVIETPREKTFGDYSSNIAMQLTRVLRTNPRNIATSIIENFNKDEYGVEKIEIAGPGFINFFMKVESLSGVILDILKAKDDFGKNDLGKGIKFNVEYVSANPTGDLHIGHARQAALGDSICRILETCGYDVTREYYVNDAGNQIHNLALSLIARYYQLFDIDKPLPEDGYYGNDIIDIASEIKSKYGDKYLNDDSKETYEFFREYGLKAELEKIKQDLEYFRVKFNVWSSEQAIRDKGSIEKVVEFLREKGYLYEHDNATWFKSSSFGDDKDRVIIKSDGSYTYITPDIAYHLDKLERGYDYLVDLLGADHHGYINRMKAAIMALGYEADKLEIDIVQMVRAIKDGEEFKMSKRSGKALTLRDLCDEAGVDAIRYFFVARSPSSHLDFDIDLATKQSNENPVYYVQYAHARMCSINKLASDAGITINDDLKLDLLDHPAEIELLKHLNDYISTIVEACKDRAPYRITNYAYK
ncbi:TPA: arginine--tRNA ligase, partial [bacterium]|nr:arginine--tRNA ligase [bacterium]